MSGIAVESSAVIIACGTEKTHAKSAIAPRPTNGPPYVTNCSEPIGPPLTLKKTIIATETTPSLRCRRLLHRRATEG